MIPYWKKDKRIYEIVENIRTLKVQGAHNVARTSIQILKDVVLQKGFESKEFKEMAEFLQNLRPTQVITYNLIEYIKHKKDVSAFPKIERFLEKCYEEIFKNALDVLEGNEVLMTHCHSSEELYVLKRMHEKFGYDFTVYVTETRPRMQGIRSAKELAKSGIKVRYIVDDAAGFYMDDIDALVVGIDAITPQGVWNKIGTYLMALAAKHHRKDVIFIGDIMKLDLRDKTYVEMRNPNEIISTKEFENLGVEVLNPSFDLTPWHLIDYVVTGVGIIENERIFEHLSYEKLFKVVDRYPIMLEEVI